MELNYEVVIIGGGPAGVTAAIAAARRGARVLLVEQSGYLGGSLTGAGVGPQMTFHAGDTQVVRGIPDEIVERMKAKGFSPGHMEDFVGYASSITPFDAEGLKLVLEEMALEAGVQLLYHTVYTGCQVQDGRITSVTLYAKNGFFTVTADVFLDCSADADLATHAGVSSVYGRDKDNLAQPMTMNIKVGGVDREKVMEYVRTHPDDMLATIPFDHLDKIPRTGIQGAYSVIRAAKEAGEFNVDRDMVLCFETNTPGEFILNMSRIVQHSAVDPFQAYRCGDRGPPSGPSDRGVYAPSHSRLRKLPHPFHRAQHRHPGKPQDQRLLQTDRSGSAEQPDVPGRGRHGRLSHRHPFAGRRHHETRIPETGQLVLGALWLSGCS